MKHAITLLLGLASLSAAACTAHHHGLRTDNELLTIDLTSGLR